MKLFHFGVPLLEHNIYNRKMRVTKLITFRVGALKDYLELLKEETQLVIKSQHALPKVYIVTHKVNHPLKRFRFSFDQSIY
jgi:hypothetical protein